MSISIKTPDEIEKMRIAGRLTAQVLDMIGPFVIPGVTTESLDQRCHDFIVDELKAIPAPLNYRGFPKSVCTSVNDEVCHGIPSDRVLKEGDIVNIDVSVIKDLYHGDSSKMFAVGECKRPALRLVEITQECLYKGIEAVHPGQDLKEIGRLIEHYARSQGCSVVHEYCGHGIGLNFHEEPQVVHYYDKSSPSVILVPGMTFTIEPMINAGKRDIKHCPKDGWTVKTKDRSLSAQWEHTLLVTETGVEVLTLRAEEETLLARIHQ
ncbi:MAG: type I methionyl aminopeptidase [Gammaproteobacteria bacterium]